jgi:hypothetical protein
MSHKIFRSIIVLVLVIGLVFFVQAPQSVRAAGPWYVTTTGDDNNNCLSPSTSCATINGAIGKASAGDTINVAVGTYTGTGSDVVIINKDIILSGGWDTSFTTLSGKSIIDGDGTRRGIQVNGLSISVTIENFILQNCYTFYWQALGAIYLYGTLTLNNSVIQNNQTTGIYYEGPETTSLFINNSTIADNVSPNTPGISGGIEIRSSGLVTINNSSISGNSGSGIVNESGVVSINTSTITNNHGAVWGAGIHNQGDLTIESSVVNQNTTASGYNIFGGGVYNRGSLSISDSSISNNMSYGQGGGIYNNGSLSISDSNITSNSSYTGGGIYNSGGYVSLNNSIVSENTTDISGSGIRNLGRLTLRDTTVMNNSATGNGVSGAGISNEGFTEMVNSSIVGNTSTNIGAGINNWGVFKLVNSTVSGNSPGGIVNSSRLDMYNTTVTNNTSSSVGGGIFNFNIAILSNTIIGGNFGSAGSPDCFGTLTSRGHNLIQNTTGCTISGDTTGNVLGVDPMLGPLQDNGGPTLTHALLTGSPAIDAGDESICPSTDQRGVARPQGAACDIGAFEFVATIDVSIDIKPGSETNPINTKSMGTIPVAILSTADFDAPSMVDKNSLTFGISGEEESLAFCNDGAEDVNEDGLLDLMCHFDTQLALFGGTRARFGHLKGYTIDGVALKGYDNVTILR